MAADKDKKKKTVEEIHSFRRKKLRLPILKKFLALLIKISN
jgi:hypothetical protein